MKKMIIRSILVISIGTIGGLYYLWQEATKVPDEYTEAVTANNTIDRDLSPRSSQINTQKNISNNKLFSSIDRAKFGQKVTIELNNKELNKLVLAKLASTQSNKQIPPGIKGINTNIKDGKIYTGALVNLDRLVHDLSSGSQVAALSKLTDRLPFLKDRYIYVGVLGKPIVVDSKIKLDRDTQIKIGKMNFTISQLAENLGIAPEKIQQAIDLKLQQQHLRIDRVEVDNDRLAIEGETK
jgi:hypothetical protein